MIAYSTNAKQILRSGGRQFRIQVVIDGAVVTAFEGNTIKVKVVKRCVQNDEFALGGGSSTYTEIIARNIPSRYIKGGQKIQIILYYKNPDVDKNEYSVTLSTFKCGRPTTDKDSITFSGYGSIGNIVGAEIEAKELTIAGESTNKKRRIVEMALGYKYDTSLAVPDANIRTALAKEIPGIIYDTEGKAIDGKAVILDVCTEMAESVGGFLVEDHATTEVIISQFIKTTVSIPSDIIYEDIEYDGIPFSINGIRNVHDGKTAGATTGNVININNAYADQEDLNAILARTRMWNGDNNTFSFIPCSISFLGDPHIEPGDVIDVQQADGSYIHVPVMYHELEYDGGLKSTVKCFGVDNNSNDNYYTAPTQQKMDILEQNLMNYVDDKIYKNKFGNLWIGAKSKSKGHHEGATYVSTGSGRNVIVNKPNGTSRKEYIMLDTENVKNYIQSGTVNSVRVTTADKYVDYEVTFPTEMDSVPYVTVSLFTSGTGDGYGGLNAHVLYRSVTTKGFTVRVWNSKATSGTPAIQWQASVF